MLKKPLRRLKALPCMLKINQTMYKTALSGFHIEQYGDNTDQFMTNTVQTGNGANPYRNSMNNYMHRVAKSSNNAAPSGDRTKMFM